MPYAFFGGNKITYYRYIASVTPCHFQSYSPLYSIAVIKFHIIFIQYFIFLDG